MKKKLPIGIWFVGYYQKNFIGMKKSMRVGYNTTWPEVAGLEMRTNFWLKPEASRQHVRNTRIFENNIKTHPKDGE
jgi:hypothetical protein